MRDRLAHDGWEGVLRSRATVPRVRDRRPLVGLPVGAGIVRRQADETAMIGVDPHTPPVMEEGTPRPRDDLGLHVVRVTGNGGGQGLEGDVGVS